MKKLLLLSLLIIQPAFAELVISDTQNGCGDDILSINNNHANMHAIYTRNQHTCSNGTFLPANIDECRTCGLEHACPGGTYVFNENKSQGIDFKIPFTQSAQNACVKDLIHVNDNNHSNIHAIFIPNKHTCNPGYYLPAGVDSCTICPQNNKCAGGTYYFNETNNQGIEQCANSIPFATAGSTICYPHVLHIGDDVIYLKSTKLTTPSLNVGMDDGIFYANMTTTPTPMNNATEHVLKIEYDGVVYYVCDDTTYGK